MEGENSVELQLGRNALARAMWNEKTGCITAFWEDLWSIDGCHKRELIDLSKLFVAVHSDLNPRWTKRKSRPHGRRPATHMWSCDFVESLPTGEHFIHVFKPRSPGRSAWKGVQVHIIAAAKDHVQ